MRTASQLTACEKEVYFILKKRNENTNDRIL